MKKKKTRAKQRREPEPNIPDKEVVEVEVHEPGEGRADHGTDVSLAKSPPPPRDGVPSKIDESNNPGGDIVLGGSKEWTERRKNGGRAAAGAIIRELEKAYQLELEDGTKVAVTGWEAIAAKFVEKLFEGDMQAYKLLFDKVDGTAIAKAVMNLKGEKNTNDFKIVIN